MKSFIEGIYLSEVEKMNSQRRNKVISDKETELRNTLCKNLNDEQTAIFEKFLDVYSERLDDNGKQLFYRGLKKGMELVFDTLRAT